MALAEGTRLGPYEIRSAIGAGGMGEVYRARDTKLNRDVALKILPAAFAQDPDRLARFRREAQVLAALNHPNIAAIHGLEDSGETHSLVMEFVPGDTLAEIMTRPMPADEALPIVRQIAVALEAAHEQSIVHRDLKPANVKVTGDGTVKVLDFGLAKAIDPNAGRGLSPGASATMTSPAVTEMGVILGTASYMSPEQAKGKGADRRADIWALGVILFEMLTGRALYRGETVTETIAHVITQPLPWDALPPATPPAVRRLLRRMLEKDPRNRLQSAGDVRIEIDECLTAPAQEPVTPVGGAWRATKRIAVGATLVVLGVVAGFAGRGLFGSSGPEGSLSSPLHLSITTPAHLRVRDFKITPDGTRLIIRASPVDSKNDPALERQLYARTLDSYDFTPIAGTTGAQDFTFSPDSQWVAVVVRTAQGESGRRLIKVPINSSTPPVALAEWTSTSAVESFTWLADGGLLVMTTENNKASVFRIPTSGGPPTKPVAIQHDDKLVPVLLGGNVPGGRVFLQLDGFSARGYQTNVWLLDPLTGVVSPVIENAFAAKYIEGGRIVFSRESTLMTMPFDLRSSSTTGEVSAVMAGLRALAGPGTFALADNGTLAYAPSTDLSRQLITIGPGGQVSPFVPQLARFSVWPNVSRDGQRAAVTVMTPGATYEIWMADASRQSLRRVLALPNADLSGAMWLRDELRLAYTREGQTKDDGLYVQRADAQGPAERVAELDETRFLIPTDEMRDGSGLVATRTGANSDVVLVPTPVNGKPQPVRPIRATSANESSGVVSSDGRLFAYLSDESGQLEAYVAPLEKGVVGDPIMVSDGANGHVRWSVNGSRLYFCARTSGRLMAVDVRIGPTLTVSDPVQIADLIALRVNAQHWDVGPTGQVVAIQRSEAEDTFASINVVLNWHEEMRRRVGGSR